MARDMILLADKNAHSYDFASEVQKYLHDEKQVDVPLRGTEVIKFRNGEIGLHVPENLRGQHVYFIHDSDKTPQDWWIELLILKDMLLNSSAENVTFVLPNMMYSRQDRKERPHVPISARALAESISPGLRRIITVDLHAPQIQGFYPQNVPLDNLYSFSEAAQYIHKKHPEALENMVVVSPDVGGAHRARAFRGRLEKLNQTNYATALIDKVRKAPGKIEEMTLIGDVNGRNVLVVDDIIDSGGTLIKSGRLLKEMGAQRLVCYGTHGLFTEGTSELRDAYDNVITSNTHQQKDVGIEVVNLRPLFAEAIYRAHNNFSISELFE